MFNFLQNQWVVGIGAGIISGIIVYFITKWMFQRKDNSKYIEQINVANLEIIRTLKPYIAEKGLPEKEIIDAIILSTARKYQVKSAELYSIRIICEELIREIIENVYVSSDKKQEYSKQLREYLHKLNSEQDKSLLVSDIERELQNTTNHNNINYKHKISETLSFLLAIFSSILGGIITFLSVDTSSMITDTIRNASSLLIAVAASLLTLLIPIIVMLKQRIVEELKENKKSKKSKD